MDNKNQNRDYDRDNANQRQDRDQNQNQYQNSNQNSNRNDQDHIGRNNPDSNRDIESRWQDIESDYRRRYPNVTDEDVNYRQGEFDNMTDRLAKRTNRSRDQVNDEIRNWDSNSNRRS